MDGYEIVSLFSNILSNAEEAVENTPKKLRHIVLCVNRVNNLCKIECMNNLKENKEMKCKRYLEWGKVL